MSIKDSFFKFGLIFLALFSSLRGFSQGTADPEYFFKAVGENLILNPWFDKNDMFSTTITDWTINPDGDQYWGWRQEKTFTYGSAAWIDRPGVNTLTSNPMNLCVGQLKKVKFSFLSSNTGAYDMKVMLGGQLLGTFTNNVLLAQSKFTPAGNIQFTSVLYNFWPKHKVNNNDDGSFYINNNIWHDFTLFLYYEGSNPGALTFEYNKTGLSRQVYIDNVEVHELIKTPIPTSNEVSLPTCDGTYDLTTLNPTEEIPEYTYTWYHDSNHTTPVANPAAVKAGTYYLFASSSCTDTYSFPSWQVKVNSAEGCCGSEIIKNGIFDGASVTGTDKHLTAYNAIPNWNASGGSNYNSHHVVTNSSDIKDNANLTGLSNVYAFYTASGLNGTLNQAVTLCQMNPYKLEFDLAFSRYGGTLQGTNVELGGVKLFDIVTKTPVPVTSFGVSNIHSGLSVTVDGTVPNGTTAQYMEGVVHHFVITINESVFKTISSNIIKFTWAPYNTWYLDNVSLKALPPLAENPTSTSGVTSCPSGTFNLKTVEPADGVARNHVYQWYYDTNATNPVEDPAKVGEGTYYMQTISTCSYCVSETTQFTVINNCPKYEGDVFLDYDGPTVKGIVGSDVTRTDGDGLFAILTNSNGEVISSAPVSEIGMFRLYGNGSGVKILINNKDVAVGSIITTSTLNPNYFHTGEALGSTTPSGTADGISPIWTAGTPQTEVYFGINAAPISVGNTDAMCYDIKPTSYPIPALYGYDDNPEKENGLLGSGDKIIIKSLSSNIDGATVSTSNGALKYDGDAITTPLTIESYDPAKLIFEPTANNDPSRVVFEYVFVDMAGAESRNVAVVNYRLNLTPKISTQPLASQIICQNINPQPLTVVAQGSPDLTYQWYSNTTNSNAGGTAISGATSATYSPGTATLGTFYYYVVVSNSCGTATSNVSQITVQGSSTAFNPTVVGIDEVCAYNEGQLVINVPTGGTAPFTYKVISGTTIPDPVTTMERKQTFTNLAPGNYSISVTDVCGNTQTRGPITLKVGNSAKPDVWGVFSVVNTECGFTDYYLVPGMGTYYPHTYYAYPNGDLTQTPKTITVTGDDLVLIPGPATETGGRKGFLMRLPQVSPFVSGNGIAYSFKMTNACYTDLATVSVKPVKTGDFTTSQISQNCSNSLLIKLGAGWHQSVSVAVTPEGGGTTRTQTIDGIQSTTVFENMAVGAYNVTLTDECGNTNTKRVYLSAPNMNYEIKSQCSSNIDGLTSFYVNPNTGWRYPISVTILDGPTSYHSPLQNKDITVTYPKIFTPDVENNPIVRIRNVVPGTYKLSITDGCTTQLADYVAKEENIENFTIPPLEWVGCPGAQDIVVKNSANCGALSIIIYQKQSDNNWRLVANGINGNTRRVDPGTYRVFYTRLYQLNELFVSDNKLVSTPEYILNQEFPNLIWLKYQDIVVPTISTQPSIGSYAVAECNSTINVRLFGSQNTARIISYELETYPGSNVYSTPQTSNYFQRTQYGKYQYRVADACGNSNVLVILIEKNTAPSFIANCESDGNIQLSASRASVSVNNITQVKYKWTLPDNTVVEGDVLNLDKNRQVGVYKLTSVNSIFEDDNTTLICAEEHSIEFWIPEPSKQFPDLTLSNSSEVSFDFKPVIPDIYKSKAQIKWFKDNVEIPGATGWNINVSQSGLYTMQVKFPPLDCSFEYSQQITVKNYWMGGTAGNPNNWATASNWTAGIVPKTLPGQTDPFEDVEFATKDNYGTDAIADLYVDNIREVANFTNLSPVNLVIPPNKSLTIHNNVNIAANQPAKIQIKASATKPTGTLIIKMEQTSPVQATVEFYNKAYDCANCGFYTRQWQYFGIPVTSSAFPTTGVETINQWSEPANGNKWISAKGNLTAFTGYEITNSSTTPPTNIYKFTGALNLTDATVNLSKTSGVNYSGMNLVANSYTGAIPISEKALQFSSSLTNKTVYLFNAGTRDQWRKLNGSTVNHDTQSGQYKAVPLNLAGVGGLPDIIPSMHTFMIQADAVNTLTIKYDQLTKNDLVDGVAWRSGNGRDAINRVSTYLVMDVIGTQSADRVWLFENPATTRGFDNGWDGHKMPETDIAQIYVSGTNNDKYQVATVPQIEGTEFGFVADADENYTVNLSVTPEVESRRLYLRDLRSKQFIPVRNGVEVVVQGFMGDTGNRFRVVSEAAVAEKLSSIEVFAANRVITIVNHSDENCTAYVYDAAGRLSAQTKVNAKATSYLNMTVQGVYVVKVVGNTINETKRVVN